MQNKFSSKKKKEEKKEEKKRNLTDVLGVLGSKIANRVINDICGVEGLHDDESVIGHADTWTYGEGKTEETSN